VRCSLSSAIQPCKAIQARSFLPRPCRGVPHLPPSVPPGRKFSTLSVSTRCAAVSRQLPCPHWRFSLLPSVQPQYVQPLPVLVRACWPPSVPFGTASRADRSLPGRLPVAPAGGPQRRHSIETASVKKLNIGRTFRAKPTLETQSTEPVRLDHFFERQKPR